MPVLGYEDRYEVSNSGEVRSIGRHEYMSWSGGTRFWRPKTLRQYAKDNEYLFVTVSDGGGYSTQKPKYVHRLVYEAFKGRIPKGLIINHKDKNRANNCIDNLEAITQRENCLHGLQGRAKSSRYPGVYKETKTGYWKAMARDGGKKIYLGKYDTEELAHEAYCIFLEANGVLKYIRDEKHLLK